MQVKIHVINSAGIVLDEFVIRDPELGFRLPRQIRKLLGREFTLMSKEEAWAATVMRMKTAEREQAERQAAKPKTFKVFGSYGELTVDSTTGNVLSYDPGPEYGGEVGYSEIERFDVNEFRAYWNEEPENVDIVGIGFWRSHNRYSAPEEDYRQEIKLARAER